MRTPAGWANRLISATTAPGRCPASRPPAAGAGRSRPPPRPDHRCPAPPLAAPDAKSRSLRKPPPRRPGVVRSPLYDEAVPLSLIAGPANAGKVELLLDRYLASLDREPMLIVPNRSDVERVERDLLRRRPCLLAGSIGTFDDVFERIARAGEGARPLLSQAQRALLVRRVVADAAHGEPVLAYGFEDLTGAEWALLEALAARTEVSVSLPYEPGRPAFASLRRTAEDLSRLAGPRIEELPPRYADSAHPALAHLERALFADAAPEPVPIDGAVRFFEGAGARGAIELVGEELLALLRAGTAAERIGIVCPSVERWRTPLDTALATLGVPYSLDGEVRLAQTPLGHALTAMLRFAWLGGTRRDLFTFLRSPFSGLERRAVDFVEGRLRGRAIQTPERVVEESEKLRGAPLPSLAELRDADDPVDAVRRLAARMLRSAYGLDGPPVGESSRLDLRSYETVNRLLNELDRWRALGEELSRDDVAGALERQTLRPTRGDEEGRVAVVDLLRARTRRFDVVFVLGLEEGSLPRRERSSPFLDDDARRVLDERGARLQRPDSVSRDRYLFYTACTRPLERLYLIREAATDDGSPREPSPFWDEVQSLFDRDDAQR